MGSLAAISFVEDMRTREYAPSSLFIARLTAASIDGAASLSPVMIYAIVSVSLVVWKIAPDISRL